MRTRSLGLGLGFTLVLCGCPVAHQSGAARAQEAASELNVNETHALWDELVKLTLVKAEVRK